MTTAYDAIVLAGGAARRLGGADKPGVRVGGRSLLDRVLTGCRDAGTTVVVADPRTTARPVEWAREDPPGGGPLAALDAGLRRLDPAVPSEGIAAVSGEPAAPTGGSAPTGGPAAPSGGPAAVSGTLAAPSSALAAPDAAPEAPSDAPTDPSAGPSGLSSPASDPVVLLLSADLPFFGADTARRLVDALVSGAGAEAAVLVDGEGREQPLVGAYRVRALRREIAGVVADRGGLDGLPLRLVIGKLQVVRVAAEGGASFDCDTWGDIATARARIREHGNVLDEWITAVKDELGIDLDVDTGLLLDLARDAAHGVARPAAPLTTFLVGYAAAKAGADAGPEAVAEAARKAAALAQRWAAEQDDAG
ncbi:DUF6457 domain-containing protein [Streptomyces sp. NPDC046374]|uniref:DUF6457 domain-containing protein n=1 Tax=unclassified Streptomyces TaxID=2593676 RepID=UPI0033F6A515